MSEEYPWKTLDQETPTQRIILIYGPSGTGKTRLAGQFPKPLILACDPGQLGGSESAKEFGAKMLKINSYKHFMDVLPVLKKGAEAGEFDTVVVDSISYLSQMIMKAILDSIGREIPRFEEWNLNATRTRRLINAVADLPCHVVFTAVDSQSKDETSGKIFGGPNLPGKLQVELPQACDVVARLFTRTAYNNNGKLEVKYRYRVVPDDVWFAKDRTNKINPEGDSTFEAFAQLF